MLFIQDACDVQENQQSTVIATDISPTAVRLFDAAAARAGISPNRIQAFACNSADPAVGDAMLSGAVLMPPVLQWLGHSLSSGCRVVQQGLGGVLTCAELVQVWKQTAC